MTPLKGVVGHLERSGRKKVILSHLAHCSLAMQQLEVLPCTVCMVNNTTSPGVKSPITCWETSGGDKHKLGFASSVVGKKSKNIPQMVVKNGDLPW